MLSREGPVHTLPTGSDALILAHLAAGGQVSLVVEGWWNCIFKTNLNDKIVEGW